MIRGALLVALLAGVATDAPAQRVVSADGPYRSVAAAIAAAAPGERVVVRGGTWRVQDVVVDRPVELVGEGWPVLDAGGEHQALIVTADGVSLRGFVIRNVATSFMVDRAAVRFEEVDGCLVEDNRFEGTFFGIYLSRSSGCTVRRNRFRGAFRDESNSGNAIHLWNTVRTVVEANDVQGHRDGIYLEFARHTLVRDNDSRHNFRYGLHFMFSDSSSYDRNVFTRNGAGVAVMYSRNVHMTGNRFVESWGASSYGLLLKDLTDSRVERNEIGGNSVGLFVQGSDRLLVAGNRFLDNGWAIKLLQDSDNGRYEGNTFIGNAFDVATNSTGNSSVFDANFWDQYRGYDLDRDGHGDVPFRPVRFFSLLVERNRPALLLMRSVFVDLLDVAERVFPVLTPETLVDRHPRMREEA